MPVSAQLVKQATTCKQDSACHVTRHAQGAPEVVQMIVCSATEAWCCCPATAQMLTEQVDAYAALMITIVALFRRCSARSASARGVTSINAELVTQLARNAELKDRMAAASALRAGFLAPSKHHHWEHVPSAIQDVEHAVGQMPVSAQLVKQATTCKQDSACHVTRHVPPATRQGSMAA